MHPNQQEIVTPWYKEPFMVLILGIPLTAVIVGMIMLYNAVSGKDSLISDSYYKDGRMYTQNKTAINKAKNLLVGAVIIPNDSGISIEISGTFDQKPNVLKARFIHPTLEDRDQEVMLQLFPDGSYKGAPEQDLEGRWRLWLSSPEHGWMIQETVNFLDPDTFQIGVPASVVNKQAALTAPAAATSEETAQPVENKQ